MSRATDREAALRTALTTERAQLATLAVAQINDGSSPERISDTLAKIAELDGRVVVLDALPIV